MCHRHHRADRCPWYERLTPPLTLFMVSLLLMSASVGFGYFDRTLWFFGFTFFLLGYLLHRVCER